MGPFLPQASLASSRVHLASALGYGIAAWGAAGKKGRVWGGDSHQPEGGAVVVPRKFKG